MSNVSSYPDAAAWYAAEMAGKKLPSKGPLVVNAATSRPDAEQEYQSLLDELTAQGISPAAAIRAVAKDHPEVHAAYIRAFNQRRGHEHHARFAESS